HDDANFGVAASWTKNPGRVALISVSLRNSGLVAFCATVGHQVPCGEVRLADLFPSGLLRFY
ncbi:hypothetical protein, partial [Stutzerimonas stutzeri]|uniref:hypothetical protein n=1 Tax=Stutzerimonas stutzeri TaxID=316 RepID=UPI001C8C3C1A